MLSSKVFKCFHNVLQVGMWLNSEGEQMLKDSDASDSLGGAEKALQRFDLFLVQAKVRQRCSNRDLNAFHAFLVFSQHFPHILPKSKTFTVNCCFLQ